MVGPGLVVGRTGGAIVWVVPVVVWQGGESHVAEVDVEVEVDVWVSDEEVDASVDVEVEVDVNVVDSLVLVNVTVSV